MTARDTLRSSVEDALGKICSDPAFERSARLRALLNYLVREELAGRGDQLKGFSIAVDVFGRDESFDAGSDPLVRVQAGRLRSMLDQYYDGVGQHDTIRIRIPKGSYRPMFEWANADAAARENAASLAPDGTEPPAPLPRETSFERNSAPGPRAEPGIAIDGVADTAIEQVSAKRNGLTFFVVLSSLLSAIALGVAVLVYVNSRQPQQASQPVEIPTSASDAVISLPSLQIVADLEDDLLHTTAIRIAAGVGNFDTLRAKAIDEDITLQALRQNAASLDYALHISRLNGVSAEQADIKVDAVHLMSGDVLRSELFEPDVWSRSDIAELVSRNLSGVANPDGLIYADILARGNETPEIACLTAIAAYYANPSAARLQPALACSARYIERPIRNGLLASQHAGLLGEAATKERNASKTTKTKALQDALVLALDAARASPTSARTAREVGYLYSLRNELSAMASWFARAYTLNPYDTSIAASYGYSLVLTGRYDRAADVLGSAVRATMRHPTWWDYYHGLALLMAGQKAAAAKAIEPLGVAQANFMYRLLDVVVTYENGDWKSASQALEDIRESFPHRADDLQAQFERRHYPPDLIDLLMRDIAEIGSQSAPE